MINFCFLHSRIFIASCLKNNTCANKCSSYSWQICHSFQSEPTCKASLGVIKDIVLKIPVLTVCNSSVNFHQNLKILQGKLEQGISRAFNLDVWLCGSVKMHVNLIF